ncbi:MAG: mandelate racemase/muconate lactonizing enzyme family protein [Aggregatilineales bacterium]
MPSTLITDYSVTRFAFPRERVIGDSQVRIDMFYTAVLELHTNTGCIGTGFMFSLFHSIPNQKTITTIIDDEIKPTFLNKSPIQIVNLIRRARGGNQKSLPLKADQAINQAAWDIVAQEAGLPLYQILGGTDNQVTAYASGLEYHLSDDEIIEFYETAKTQGFKAYKVKVGHPDLEWDIQRLRFIQNIMGTEARLMIDANEAWSPKEAIRRLWAYREAGFNVYWAEDPCLRDDYEGLKQVSDAIPFTHINTGEYLDLDGKRQLLETRAVDILNLHGHITEGMRAGWLASEYGVPVSIGNTPFNIGIHLAAALPEVRGFEMSFQGFDYLVENQIQVKDGIAFAPDIPGHGVNLSGSARQEFALKD